MFQQYSFDNFFEVVLADTPETKQIHYRLRYQVYCEELGFEDKTRFPRQMENDEWDEHAAHFLVRNRRSGLWLGALRIVLPNRMAFPFEDKCKPHRTLDANDYQESVEISRLCVVKEARRFIPNDGPSTLHESQANAAANISYLHKHHARNRSLMWGLLRAAVVYSAQHNFKHWYFLISQPLAHCLQKQGFKLQRIGGYSTASGYRCPYTLEVAHFITHPMWQSDYKIGFIKHSELLGEIGYLRRRA